ncbi:MAG: hypothetical protein U5Q03_05435 [Bacteroidota bacterium]|nr:hypothetical protein [Bacteroidota bacterium]
MVKITDFKEVTNREGETFYSLILTGGLEMVKSKETGSFYATAKTARVTSTFSKEYCESIISSSIPGVIKWVECEEYEYTVQETGEVIRLSHRWEYFPEAETPSGSKD